MKILILDNYDSFTHNLVQIVRQSGICDYVIFKNDTAAMLRPDDFDGLLISPGPGVPSGAGICKNLIHRFAGRTSILGICLGHQAIAEIFGGRLYQLPEVRHGVSVKINVMGDPALFGSQATDMRAGLYHSWAVSCEDFPEELEITAYSEEGVIMALKHRTYEIRGVQFHPESILTLKGAEIIENWLRSIRL